MLTLQNAAPESAQWETIGVQLPRFDYDQVAKQTAAHPEWIHFGAGNIFRGFIADLAQRLLDKGQATTGIIAADTFDYEIIDRIYTPFKNRTLLVLMNADGSLDKKIVSSVTEALHADFSSPVYRERLKTIFAAPSLKMVSFTITEKGYSLRTMDGSLSNIAALDMANGPEKPVHAMSVVTALLLERYRAGEAPLALVSMDNCSHNGEKLQNAVFEIADAWCKNGFVDGGFISYIHDESKIAFPWSMIDKITPRPAEAVQIQLQKDGITDMQPITTAKNTYIAPFVNAEKPQYLVLEDAFPAGRPRFECLTEAGVYLTDRATVNRTEQMKVCTCLNPLHTALAVFGCLLGYTSIASEMKNPLLAKLVTRIGYDEGLPVVVDPKIIAPRAFIDEVVQQRLPNPFIPDTPQRIVTDTSQKIPVRFGGTIRAYVEQNRDMSTLVGIPLAIAGWFRYVLALDDNGNPMELSSDPMLGAVQSQLCGVRFGEPNTAHGALDSLLSNTELFGVDLTQTPLAEKIIGYFTEMISGTGKVNAVLSNNL